MKDTLIVAKLHFSLTVARLFSPFLKKYQTDEPVMPFLSNDLAEMIKVQIYMDSSVHYQHRTIATTD